MSRCESSDKNVFMTLLAVSVDNNADQHCLDNDAKHLRHARPGLHVHQRPADDPPAEPHDRWSGDESDDASVKSRDAFY